MGEEESAARREVGNELRGPLPVGQLLLDDLAAALGAGQVKGLLLLGVDPAYDAPASLKLAEAIEKICEGELGD